MHSIGRAKVGQVKGRFGHGRQGKADSRVGLDMVKLMR